MNDNIINGIFTKHTLNSNQKEFCVISDVHIACGDRNDYVFDDNGNPLSYEAYMLKMFCDKVSISGNRKEFNDGNHYLILLGDVINGGECGYYNCYKSYAYRLLQKTLEPWLYTGNILYFAGNHDRYL